MKNNTVLDVIVAILIGVIILGAIVYGALKPKFEAGAFNKCTGGNASYMTALFTELRVEFCTQSDSKDKER